ncbi:MAG: hypothetical protein HQK60_16515 [Deltaproteobacteria bacterium]|nr:hypothetical protein [Deltaproteobacteria bacterium]
MDVSLILIFNHEFTEAQEKDARASLGIGRITELPSELKTRWGQIPSDLEVIEPYIRPIKDWLAAVVQEGDYVLIQGDFGGAYLLVNYAFELGLIPVYSTTRRVAVKVYNDDGSVTVTRQFNHEIFRRYER